MASDASDLFSDNEDYIESNSDKSDNIENLPDFLITPTHRKCHKRCGNSLTTIIATKGNADFEDCYIKEFSELSCNLINVQSKHNSLHDYGVPAYTNCSDDSVALHENSEKGDDYKVMPNGFGHSPKIVNNADESDEEIRRISESKHKIVGIFSDSESESNSEDELFQPITKDDYRLEITKIPVNGSLNFIHSLLNDIDDIYRDKDARLFRANFKYWKDKLSRRIFDIFNRDVFFNKLPNDTEIVFKKRFLRLGGRCHCRFLPTSDDNGNRKRYIRIELSDKILNDSQRLLEVLIHEMCHGAVWMINKSYCIHGKEWREWTVRAHKIYPLVPISTRCHYYHAKFKYVFTCPNCKSTFKRHSKSIKNCKYCECELSLKVDGGYGIYFETDKNKPVKGFAEFVQKNYKNFRNKGSDHKTVMKALSKQYELEKQENVPK